MFEGQIGKDLMIKQGYAPPICTLPPEIAGPLIYSEICNGRSPCDGCNEDRSVCNGKPKQSYNNGMHADLAGLSVKSEEPCKEK